MGWKGGRGNFQPWGVLGSILGCESPTHLSLGPPPHHQRPGCSARRCGTSPPLLPRASASLTRAQGPPHFLYRSSNCSLPFSA